MIPPRGDSPPPFPDGTDLADVDDELLDALIRNVTLAADSVAIGFRGTPAEQTRAVIRAAIRNGLRNGALVIAPRDAWPEWWQLDA